MSNIFITGATGFLGSNLLREILTKKDNNAYLLVRAKDSTSPLNRKNDLINRVFPKSKPMRSKVSSRIHIMKGDITKHDLGLNKKDIRMLRNTIDTVYHCAASLEFYLSISAIRKINVKGTQNVLKMTLDWKNKGRLENVNHISTIYIAGDYKGTFYEGETDVSQNFHNTYEQSKFEAEMVVLKYRKKGLPVDIYRPSIILDRDGTDINTPPITLFFTGFVSRIFEKVPADSNAKINMIPSDAAAKAIYLISTTKKRPLNQTYHIVNPKPVKIISLLNTFSAFFKCKKPECIPAAKFRMDGLSPVQRRMIGPFIPYLNQKLSFDMRNTSSVLKRYGFAMPDMNKRRLVMGLKRYRSSGLIPKKRRPLTIDGDLI